MTIDHFIDQLKNAHTVWIVSANNDNTTCSMLVSDLDKVKAERIIADTLEAVFENEIEDEQAPQVLNTWLGKQEQFELN